MKNFTRFLAMLFITLLTAGCATWQTFYENSAPAEAAIEMAHPFKDLPVPADFDIDRPRSFIYESGSGSFRVGRLYYTGSTKQEEVVDFYKNEMINQGWSLINSIDHDVVLLNYEKEGWACSLAIASRFPEILGSQIKVQIGPK